MTKANEIISMAESLPIDIKTQLIDRLLNSLHPSQKEIKEILNGFQRHCQTCN